MTGLGPIKWGRIPICLGYASSNVLTDQRGVARSDPTHLNAKTMNTPRTRLLALLAVSALFAPLARADETAYAKILKERDLILSQIVTQREAQFAIGSTDDGALVAARLALWSFRRDTTPSKAEKIKQQELIVEVFQKELVAVKSRVTAGLAGREDILLATDSLLQARQFLEELQLNELDAKKG